MNDLIGLLLSGVYLFSILSLGQLLYRKGRLSPNGFRKWVHLLAGSWILPCVYLFDHWYWAALLPLIFVAVNLWGRAHLSLSFESEEKFGPVYFPISFVVLISLFWDWPLRWIACVSLLIMAWADAGAALVGQKWGRHPFSLLGARKSMEGSLAMILISFLTCWAVFRGLGRLPIASTLWVSSTVASVVTAVEAVSGRGLDNLTVPFAAALVSYLMLFGPG